MDIFGRPYIGFTGAGLTLQAKAGYDQPLHTLCYELSMQLPPGYMLMNGILASSETIAGRREGGAYASRYEPRNILRDLLFGFRRLYNVIHYRTQDYQTPLYQQLQKVRK